MDFAAGICPKCHEYLLLKNNVPFLVCPMCGATISNQEATTLLNSKCHDPQCTTDLVADCIALEMEYGPQLPFLILGEIVDTFPHLESPAYLITKMTGYALASVRLYLESFAKIKSQPDNVPWAEEFLKHCLTYRNMEFADLLAVYIQNKIRPEKQAEYQAKLQKLRQEYTFKASDPRSTKLLITLYLTAAVLNVLLFPALMLLSGWLSQYFYMYYALNFIIAILLVSLEIGLMFWHNKVFGNRLNMSQFERTCMVIFMASIIFAIGASVMGSIWKIKL